MALRRLIADRISTGPRHSHLMGSRALGHGGPMALCITLLMGATLRRSMVNRTLSVGTYQSSPVHPVYNECSSPSLREHGVQVLVPSIGRVIETPLRGASFLDPGGLRLSPLETDEFSRGS